MTQQKPRFTIEVTQHQKEVFDKYVPHGLKKVILGSIVDDCCYMIETYGATFIAALVAKEVNFRSQMDGTDRELTTKVNE